MVERAQPIPEKLKADAIVEALAEMRFDIPAGSLPEISFVRLAENPSWRNFKQQMMPLFHIPAQVRMSEGNLRYQPCLELTAPDHERTIRIGPQVLSYHRLAPYVGWNRFQPEIAETIEWLFSQVPEIRVRRIGLRYMNALRADVHGIKSVLDLNLTLAIAGDRVGGNVNINFTDEISSDTVCTVRVATPEFIQGTVPPQTSVYVDVDVFTKEDFATGSRDVVLKWITNAHAAEKRNFFRLLTNETISELKEI